MEMRTKTSFDGGGVSERGSGVERRYRKLLFVWVGARGSGVMRKR